MREDQRLKLNFRMPYEIIKVMGNGKCLVNAITEPTKCPDCDEKIRYRGTSKLSIFQLWSEDKLNTLKGIQYEYGTKDAIEYFDIVVNALIEAHPLKEQISR
jgi:hypothetical protein